MDHLKYFKLFEKKKIIILDQVNNFLNSPRRNEWLSDGIIDVYVRKSKRVVEGKLIDFIDIANVSVKEDKREQGIFTNFMNELMNKYQDKNIYVESILNPKVSNILSKLGFKIDIKDDFQQNMYLIR